MQSVDLLIKGGQVVTAGGHGYPVSGQKMQDLQVIDGGWVACKDGWIIAVGREREITPSIRIDRDTVVIDAKDKVISPGLIDPHTHLVFGGSREDEFVLRAQGAEYMEIMAAGGGILSTVKATREASLEDLRLSGRRRLDWMLRMGTTTVENKSGYGLNLETELKQLQAGALAGKHHPVEVIQTFLGAHAWPTEYEDDHQAYVDLIIHKMLPKVREQGLAEFCDVFCETGVFSIEETRQIMLAAKQLGFELRLHADEMTSLGGAELAAELGAVSADHLLMISDKGIQALAEAGVVPILLPATAFTLQKPYAPARRMLEAGLPVALASDFNPGSSPTPSLTFTMALACLYMKMTPEEAWHAVTINAAHSLRRGHILGSLEVGKQADIVIFDVDNYRKVPYFYGVNLAEVVIKQGKVVADNKYGEGY